MLRLWKREHRGIRLRVSTPSGVVLEVDSDELYLASHYTKAGGWRSLIPGGPDGAGEFSQVPLKIEIQPAMLEG